jgi:hypothetical protein
MGSCCARTVWHCMVYETQGYYYKHTLHSQRSMAGPSRPLAPSVTAWCAGWTTVAAVLWSHRLIDWHRKPFWVHGAALTSASAQSAGDTKDCGCKHCYPENTHQTSERRMFSAGFPNCLFYLAIPKFEQN